MKHFYYLLVLLIFFISCNKKKEVISKDYAIFSGVITNSTQDHFKLYGKHINKRIAINKDGSFLDTLKIKVITTNAYKINNNQLTIYIKNGYRLTLQADANNLHNTAIYTGIGAEENNYLLAQNRYGAQAGNVGENGLFSLSEEKFNLKMNEYKAGLDSINLVHNNIDKDLLELTKKQNVKALQLVKNLYNTSKDKLNAQQDALQKLVRGTVSPRFTNYESLDGKLYNLTDFKGSYVFIDIWGTWIKKYTDKATEINNFKKKNADKNIQFLTLCADNVASAGTLSFAKQKWKTAVEKYQLQGLHLFIGDDKEFLKNYKVLFLPRYILIDPKGNIISANAPAPNTFELNNLFSILNL
ncbi:peroxiredoxin family protein [Polaribacter sp.]|uniref:peroxiredoxin family protein n=1 Tax=Polaribacter sp. TaxID=1920175 RepID=UPI003EFAB483